MPLDSHVSRPKDWWFSPDLDGHFLHLCSCVAGPSDWKTFPVQGGGLRYFLAGGFKYFLFSSLLGVS